MDDIDISQMHYWFVGHGRSIVAVANMNFDAPIGTKEQRLNRNRADNFRDGRPIHLSPHGKVFALSFRERKNLSFRIGYGESNYSSKRTQQEVFVAVGVRGVANSIIYQLDMPEHWDSGPESRMFNMSYPVALSQSVGAMLPLYSRDVRKGEDYVSPDLMLVGGYCDLAVVGRHRGETKLDLKAKVPEGYEVVGLEYFSGDEHRVFVSMREEGDIYEKEGKLLVVDVTDEIAECASLEMLPELSHEWKNWSWYDGMF